jgi:hypothetical protein
MDALPADRYLTINLNCGGLVASVTGTVVAQTDDTFVLRYANGVQQRYRCEHVAAVEDG